METFLIALTTQTLPLLAPVLVALAAWGVAILKKKTDSDLARNALEQVDQVVGTVVGKISQTVVQDLKAAAKDGKLTDREKSEMKRRAILGTNDLLTEAVTTAAGRAVSDLQGYIGQKIEEQVLAQKK